ncbi:MAG: LysR family transcriptional regulator [Proteobacteria bacterium]|nr:LysR family transcriptional regulator [Pseudomonadota bacterium]
MNIQQLRAVTEVALNGTNVSAAGRKLGMSQPAITKQLRQFEDELGFEVFRRSSNRLLGITFSGETVVALAKAIVADIDELRGLAGRRETRAAEPIVIATSHTQARYFLPPILKAFSVRYPDVPVTIRHGAPGEIAEWVRLGRATLAVTTEGATADARIAKLPCQQFPRIVVVPARHPLLKLKRLTLAAMEPFPLVSYEANFSIRHRIVSTFEKAGLSPRLVLSAIDSDVIKTCVEQGLGIAVLSAAVFDPSRDRKLRAIPAGHLFEPSTTHVLVRRRRLLRGYELDLLRLCTPQTSRRQIEQALGGGDQGG